MRRVDGDFADDLAAQPGFVSYEFIDCGGGEIITISLFDEAAQAEASRELAQRWTDQHLMDLRFRRLEALHGAVIVSRADEEMLRAGHAGTASRYASIRRYRLRRGGVAELMRLVDEVFADGIEATTGFEAYHALDCGNSEILSISLFRDRGSAERSDERALQFVAEQLGAFDIERTEVVGGEVRISRAQAQLLEPAHA
jgi:hypothetical protein